MSCRGPPCIGCWVPRAVGAVVYTEEELRASGRVKVSLRSQGRGHGHHLPGGKSKPQEYFDSTNVPMCGNSKSSLSLYGVLSSRWAHCTVLYCTCANSTYVYAQCRTLSDAHTASWERRVSCGSCEAHAHCGSCVWPLVCFLVRGQRLCVCSTLVEGGISMQAPSSSQRRNLLHGKRNRSALYDQEDAAFSQGNSKKRLGH